MPPAVTQRHQPSRLKPASSPSSSPFPSLSPIQIQLLPAPFPCVLSFLVNPDPQCLFCSLRRIYNTSLSLLCSVLHIPRFTPLCLVTVPLLFPDCCSVCLSVYLPVCFPASLPVYIIVRNLDLASLNCRAFKWKVNGVGCRRRAQGC